MSGGSLRCTHCSPLRPAEGGRPPADSRKRAPPRPRSSRGYFLPRPSNARGLLPLDGDQTSAAVLPTRHPMVPETDLDRLATALARLLAAWWRRQQTELESAAGIRPAARAGHRTTNTFPRIARPSTAEGSPGGAMTAGRALDYARRAHAAGYACCHRGRMAPSSRGRDVGAMASGRPDGHAARRLVRARPHRHCTCAVR